jgi:hypothetical protein
VLLRFDPVSLPSFLLQVLTRAYGNATVTIYEIPEGEGSLKLVRCMPVNALASIEVPPGSSKDSKLNHSIFELLANLFDFSLTTRISQYAVIFNY